jgi:ADP-ribose pyrophosphatase YjhB (NUDIX family)
MILLNDELEKIHCLRAGIIPYIIIDGKLYFLLGIDRQTGEYADMGGGVKKNENVISGAIRELTEETRDLVQPIHLCDISVGVWEKVNNNCILFSKIADNGMFDTLEDDFQKSTKKGIEYDEMSALVWLTVDQLVFHIYSDQSKMWARTRFTLSNCGNFDDYLLSLLK